LTDRGALFDDGSAFDCDAIIACTGYRNSFPVFLSEDTLRQTVAGTSLT
jgi:lysine/ornithine N-monooxygenase